MGTHRTQLAEQLKELAATFVGLESNRRTLITITDVALTDALDRVTFLVSVYPQESEGPALGFLLRKRGECRTYIKTHLPIARIPHVEFALDEGDKKRQRIDELLQGQ
jgi:ribosome-binding factor A